MRLLRRHKDPFLATLEPLLKQHARKAGVGCTFVSDDDKYMVGSSQIQLGNLRRGWTQREADEQGPWLDTVVAGLFSSEIPSTLADGNADHVMVGLRSRATVEHVRLLNAALDRRDNTGVPAKPITSDLGAVLVWDTPTTMGMVNQGQLHEWGEDFDSLYDVGLDNLRSLATMGWAALDNRTFTMLDADDYVSSRLLLPELLDTVPLTGPVVAIVPNRSTLIVTALDDADGICFALDLAQRELDQPSQVSFLPIVGRGASWRALELHPEHPGSAALRHLSRMEAATCADSTQKPLQKLVGEDLFVAALTVYDDDGVVTSIATWARGVPTLLPRADKIAFVRDDSDVVMASWDQVAQALGPMLEPTAFYPERHRVLDFPTDAQLTTLAT